MRYKIIDDERLNVYLTEKDLEKENVKLKDIVDASAESMRKIKKIFSVISEIADFDIKDKGLNIILMPVTDGGLIISACISDVDILVQEEAEIFVYDDFENLLCACIDLRGICGIKSALYLFCHEYYLLIEAKKCLKECYLDFVSILSEYGRKSEYTDLYLIEHAKSLIKDDAIEKLNLFFNSGIKY